MRVSNQLTLALLGPYVTRFCGQKLDVIHARGQCNCVQYDLQNWFIAVGPNDHGQNVIDGRVLSGFKEKRCSFAFPWPPVFDLSVPLPILPVGVSKPVSRCDNYFTFDASLNGISRVVVSLNSTKTFRDGHTRVSPGLSRGVGLES